MVEDNLEDKIRKICNEALENIKSLKESECGNDETPEQRQIENAYYESETSEEERTRRYNQTLAYMNSPEAQMFYRYHRRHQNNVFNAHFYDKEKITEDDINRRVRKASQFFELPVPEMISRCETLAKITFTELIELGSEICYDVEKLKEVGINNLDAFEAMLTHELSHQVVAFRKYHFLKNDNWSKELACDFIVGARCRTCALATGKYKYAVSVTEASLTHPGGSFRVKAVKSGFEFADRLIISRRPVTMEYLTLGINLFFCKNSSAINRSLDEYLHTELLSRQISDDKM